MVALGRGWNARPREGGTKTAGASPGNKGQGARWEGLVIEDGGLLELRFKGPLAPRNEETDPVMWIGVTSDYSVRLNGWPVGRTDPLIVTLTNRDTRLISLRLATLEFTQETARKWQKIRGIGTFMGEATVRHTVDDDPSISEYVTFEVRSPWGRPCTYAAVKKHVANQRLGSIFFPGRLRCMVMQENLADGYHRYAYEFEAYHYQEFAARHYGYVVVTTDPSHAVVKVALRDRDLSANHLDSKSDISIDSLDHPDGTSLFGAHSHLAIKESPCGYSRVVTLLQRYIHHKGNDLPGQFDARQIGWDRGCLLETSHRAYRDPNLMILAQPVVLPINDTNGVTLSYLLIDHIRLDHGVVRFILAPNKISNSLGYNNQQFRAARPNRKITFNYDKDKKKEGAGERYYDWVTLNPGYWQTWSIAPPRPAPRR